MFQIELNKKEKNKGLVLEAFDTLFSKRNYIAAEHYWSPKYIQHSAHIPPGREGSFQPRKEHRPTLKYEGVEYALTTQFSLGTFNHTGLEKNTKTFLDGLQEKGEPPVYTLSPEKARAVLSEVQASIPVKKLPAIIEPYHPRWSWWQGHIYQYRSPRK